MHSSLIFLFLISIILIALMITCFICFIRSRKKEDQEFMEQVQYGAQMQSQQVAPMQHHHHHQIQPSPKLVHQSPSMINNNNNTQNTSINNDLPMNCTGDNEHHRHNSKRQMARDTTNSRAAPTLMMDYSQQMANSNGGASGPSPYHTGTNNRQEIRSDITQQINSAIIGSSEAEFQNDFIQVFPMYQIAPQPEKNTTPYLT